MGFFARREGQEEGRSDDLARIEAGGIPAGAEERLKALGSGGSLFTSGLSVKEFALLGRMGPQPLAQVMGASVVRTGWQYLPALDPAPVAMPRSSAWGGRYGMGPSATGYQLSNPYTEPSLAQVRSYKWHATVVCELDTLSDAWNLARRRAIDRLTEEALQVGADAVVGVHLHRSDHDLGSGTIEYAVSGTAIRVPGSEAAQWPILTDVSVQDYWRLRSAGREPVGLLATSEVVFASPPISTRLRRARQLAQNQELEELSRGFHAARDTIRARLLGQVSDAHAEGAVGVEFAHQVHREKLAVASSLTGTMRRGWRLGRLGIPYKVSGGSDVERRGWVITMHAAGTAIRTVARQTSPQVKTSMRMRST
ncbi:MAG: heavy metal-binding domain-containing protein [Solirubrobacterales bacterium]|nr:heavy metal-binding domain-containing protein [Solirubrobacterales bacterium]